MDKSKIDKLACAGGGSRDIAILGSLMYLEEQGILQNIKKYSGTSMGAVITSLLVINYSPKEINDTIFSQNSLIVKEPFYKVMYNLFTHYGLYSADKMYAYIGTLFEKKGFSKNITFKELHEQTDKILTMTGTSVSEQDTLYFNCYTVPDMKVIDGIRISISIPIYFSSVKHLFENQQHILVDGGMLQNFPLYYYDICEMENKWVFKSTDLEHQKEMCLEKYKDVFSMKKDTVSTIGIILFDKNEIDKTNNKICKKYTKISNIYQYFTELLDTMLSKIEENNFTNPITGAKDNFFKETIIIELPIAVSAIDFDLSDENKSILVTAGYNAANDFFTDT